MNVNEELRSLFVTEADERLSRCGELLLAFERGETDDLYQSLMREMHTLKGGAGVVGLGDIGEVAHRIEDVLVRARASGADIATIDVLLAAVDELRIRIPRAVEGIDESDALRDLAARVAASTAPSEHVQMPALPASRPADAARGGETARIPVRRIEEMVRLIGEAAAAHLRVGAVLTDASGMNAGGIAEYRHLSKLLGDLHETVLRVRMVSVSAIAETLHRAVRDAAHRRGRTARFELSGAAIEIDRGVLDSLADPLVHMVRNAVDHGLEPPDERVRAGKPAEGVVRVEAIQRGPAVVVVVTDDGRGLDLALLRAEAERSGIDTSSMTDESVANLVFRAGLSTVAVSDVSGRGVGLDIVGNAVAAIRGRVTVASRPGAGTVFRITVPATIAMLPCLIVRVCERDFGIPLHAVRGAARTGQLSVEGHPLAWLGEQAVAVTSLSAALGLPATEGGPVVVIETSTGVAHGFAVESLVGIRDVFVQALEGPMPVADLLVGAGIDPDGSVVPVLDSSALCERIARAPIPTKPQTDSSTEAALVLIVDDALTVRELQRSILRRAGYRVRVASDGQEALAVLAEGPVDLILTDIEMPRLDGFELVAAIRSQPALQGVPVVIMTSRETEQDRIRALEAGADAFIMKSSFDEAALLAVVRRLLGADGP